MKTVGSLIANTNVDDLSERISFRNFIVERNERGDIKQRMEFERCRCWAKVLPLTARISDDMPERTSNIHYRVIVRYRDDIKPNDEIVWRERRLRLLSPPFDAESRRIFTVMDCEEIVEDDVVS